MNCATNIGDYAAIRAIIQHYIDGAISGKGEAMRPAFHTDATIYGYVGNDWNDSNGPATELVSHIVAIDIAGTVASVRLESDNWTGHRFTDFFNLLKIDGRWQIMNKVFHLHA